MKHLTKEQCPHCKAETKSKIERDKHCSGEWNEERTYTCGHALHYSPNFMQSQETRPCPRTPAVQAADLAWAKLKGELLRKVEKAEGVSDNIKKRLKYEIQTIREYY